MAYIALRPMQWGTATGTVNVKPGDALDTTNVHHRRLMQLAKRGWISDQDGKARGEIPLPDVPPPAPAAPAEPPEGDPGDLYTADELAEMSRGELQLILEDWDLPKSGSKAELVDRILESQE